MASLQAADIADLLVATLEDLGRLRMQDNMSTYQSTIFLKRMAKKGKMKFQNGGDECQFNRILSTNGSARSVGLYYTANVNPTNVLGTGKMPWRHVTWNWGIERREIRFNSGSAYKILDMIKTRRIAAHGDAVILFEQMGWRVAADGSTDFQGIPYWIVKSNTAATAANNDGFNGTAPSGHTLVGNINPTTDTKWRNYATQYTAVTGDDLVAKMERASDYTDFMPLVDETPQYNVGNDYGYYTTYDVRQEMKEILKAQNENLGFDLDPVAGKLVFRRSPVVWVKELDQDTTGPIYGINWGVFYLKGLEGEWMKETVFDKHPNQPTVSATHTDCSLNTYCVDRRRLFVLATDTTMP